MKALPCLFTGICAIVPRLKLLWIVVACVVVIDALPASATYYYTGSVWGTINTGTICQPIGADPCVLVPNPNAVADAASFGMGMTGSVTFNFDTTGVSGTAPLGDPGSGNIPQGGFFTGFLLTAGSHSVIGSGFTINTVTLTNGEFTGWHLTAVSDYAFRASTAAISPSSGAYFVHS
jgi:hypothetical protein